MTKDEIFVTIKKSIIDVLPLVEDQDISPEKQLVDLGANSIDRSEIVISSMAAIQVKVAPSELGKAKNIQSLIDIFYEASVGDVK